MIALNISQDQTLNDEEEDVLVKNYTKQSPPKNIEIFNKYLKFTATNILPFLLIILQDIIFNGSIIECLLKNVSECTEQVVLPNKGKWSAVIISSGVVFAIIFVLAIRKIINRIYAILIFLNLLILFYASDNYITYRHYRGMFNLGLVLSFALFCIVIGIIYFFAWLVKTKKYFTIGSFFLLVTVVLLGFNHYVMKPSCALWTTGLNEESIDISSPQYCQMVIPKTCWIDIFDGIQDLSRIQSQCSDIKTNDNKYFKGVSPFIGFIPTTNFSQMQRMDDFALQSAVLNKSMQFAVNSAQEAFYQGAEYVLNNVQDSSSHYIIKVQKKDEIVALRDALMKESAQQPIMKNILYVYIDAVSRRNAHRKLKKTLSWFATQNIKNKNNNDRESFEFFRYLATAPYTYRNNLKLIYGEDFDHSYNKQNQSIYALLKEKGFITSRVTDLCLPAFVEYVEPHDNYKHLLADHEGVVHACDPNYFVPNNGYNFFKGPNSLFRRCLYAKDVSDYNFEYGQQFWQSYKNESKFMSLEFMEAHEPSGEVIKYMDGNLYNFLSQMQESGELNDTAVILLADHGLHLRALSTFDSVQNEVWNPMLFVSMPTQYNQNDQTLQNSEITKGEFQQQYDSLLTQLRENKQKAIDGMNIHHFIAALAYGINYQQFNESLLGDLPAGKDCYSFMSESLKSGKFCQCLTV